MVTFQLNCPRGTGVEVGPLQSRVLDPHFQVQELQVAREEQALRRRLTFVPRVPSCPEGRALDLACVEESHLLPPPQGGHDASVGGGSLGTWRVTRVTPGKNLSLGTARPRNESLSLRRNDVHRDSPLTLVLVQMRRTILTGMHTQF